MQNSCLVYSEFRLIDRWHLWWREVAPEEMIQVYKLVLHIEILPHLHATRDKSRFYYTLYLLKLRIENVKSFPSELKINPPWNEYRHNNFPKS